MGKVILNKYKFVIASKKEKSEVEKPIVGGYIITRHDTKYVEHVLTRICEGLSLLEDIKAKPVSSDFYGYYLGEKESRDITGTPEAKIVAKQAF